MTTVNCQVPSQLPDQRPFDGMEQAQPKALSVVPRTSPEDILSYFRNENGKFFQINDHRPNRQALFIDNGSAISTHSNDDAIAQAMVAKARQNRWAPINVSGTPVFIAQIEKHAEALQVKIQNSTPVQIAPFKKEFSDSSIFFNDLPPAPNNIEATETGQRHRQLTPAQEERAQRRLTRFEDDFHNKFPGGRDVHSIARWNSVSDLKLQEIRNKILNEDAEHRKLKSPPSLSQLEANASSSGELDGVPLNYKAKNFGFFWNKKLGINSSKNPPKPK
jgi:hypothetical protein